ncbi:MAG TPA: PAS domain S-box protein, partial [Lysobacter sp.]
AGLAVAYALLAAFGLRWTIAQGMASPIWPAAGVAVAGLVLGGPRQAPAVALGYLLGTLLGGSPQPLWVIASIACGNTAAALSTWWVLQRLRFMPGFDAFRDSIVFVAAAAVGAAVAAILGVAVVGATDGFTAPSMLTWSHWFLGDFTGVLVVGTLVLAWSRGGWQRPLRWLELAACLVMVGLIAHRVFLGSGVRAYTFLGFIPLIWAALSLRLRGATLACLVLAAFGVAGTTLGLGQFGGLDPHARYLDLQMFIAVSTVAALVLAVVADERRAQRALMASEARLRLALEASDTGLWKIDLRTDAMTFSPECARITGLDPRSFQLTRDGIRRLLHPDDVAHVGRAFIDALARQSLFESEFRIVRPDGGVLWLEARGRASFDDAGRPATMLGTITDITAHRRDERRLAEQARLLDLTSDAILIRDLDGRITYWNDGSVRLYGYTREQAIGRDAHELLRTRAPLPPRELDAILLRDERWDGEVVDHRRDGEARVIQSRWVLTRDGSGRPHSVMQTHADVTDRRRAEDAAALLAELDQCIGRAAGADEVAETGLALLGRHLGLQRCSLSALEPDHARIRLLHEWTDGAPPAAQGLDAPGFFASELGILLAAGEAVAARDL